jgi:hypothetical protein
LAKEPLPSVTDLTLGKAYFKNKKIFAECQIAGTWQRSKIYFAPGFFLLLSLLSLSLFNRCAPPPPKSPPPRRRRAELARARRAPLACRATASAAPPPSCRTPPSPPPATVLRYNFIKLCINFYINVFMFYRLMY